MSDSLLVPSVGPVDVLHTDDRDEIALHLRRSHRHTVYANIETVTGQKIQVAANQGQHPWPNARATKAVAHLSKLQFRFDGDVVISGVTPEQLSDLLIELKPDTY